MSVCFVVESERDDAREKGGQTAPSSPDGQKPVNPYKTIVSLFSRRSAVSQNGASPPATANEIDALAAVKTLFEITRDQIADQQKQIDGLDTKASVILGAATILAGTASVLLYGLITSHADMLTNRYLRWLPLALIVVYLVQVTAACLAYTVRRYKQVPEPQALYDDYRNKSEYFIRARVFTAMVAADKKNKAIIKKKVLWLTLSIVALELETILLVLILYFQVTY